MFAKLIMKNSLLFILLFCCLQSAFGTHNRAGEITYNQISGLQYGVTITTYTKTSSNIDRPFLELFWGDGTLDSVPRISQLAVGTDITKNVYQSTHNYPAPGTYLLHCEDMNRNGGVVNIPNSVNTSFYIESRLLINPFLGSNNSPILLNPPIDQGCIGQVFMHNPGAYDPDGDSLSYELFVCRGSLGAPCPQYYFPVASNSFSLDSLSGDLVWDTPQTQGEWNVAFLIREWRNGVNIGYVERDMQITIYPNCPNNPPILITAADTCVEAGTFLTFLASANDPDTDVVTITASGGPFLVQPDSAYLTTPSIIAPPYVKRFNWQTECNHVRKSPWAVSFKAEDSHPNIPGASPPDYNLAVYKNVNITVVSPSPKNPLASPFGNTIQLSWDQCICTEAIGYDIYRRNSYFGFIPDKCELGVPSYTGYSKIGSVQGLTNTNYTDNNNGAGLINGIDYCYMIVAIFKDGAESYASLEVCSQLKRDLPVITNVSINYTSATNGSIYIAWSKPSELDLIQTPGPFKYILYRSNDFTGVNFAVVDSFFDLNDTLYVDSMLNTVNAPWSYKIEFYNLTPGNNFKIGQSQIASSVFLSISPTDHANVLSWKELVPWTNTSYTIYRKNTLGIFDSIANTAPTSYLDTGLVNGTNYCYLIKSNGNYSATGFVNPIINFSQEKCATPYDNVPPCVPILSVTADCPNFRNILTWNFNDINCPADIGSFNIYFASDSASDPVLIATVLNGNDTIFLDDSLTSIAGCYEITAVDTNGNESGFSQKICVDNCPAYVLPTIFTPNQDGKNDTFHPFPYRYVASVDIQIFDRWGLVMFKTTDPDVNWDGTLDNKGKECPAGVYYYLCTVNEIYLSGIRPRFIKGFVQLIR